MTNIEFRKEDVKFNRNCSVGVRYTEEEYNTLKKNAKLLGLSVGAYVRMLTLMDAERLRIKFEGIRNEQTKE